MSCYAMRVQATIARAAVEGTRFGNPANVKRLLADTETAARELDAFVQDVAATLDGLNLGIQGSATFDTRPGVDRLDLALQNQGIAPRGELVNRVEEGANALTNLVEGFSMAIGTALRANPGMRTNDPNSHEMEESMVDGFLAAVTGAQGVWDWTTMRETMRRSVVGELLRDKGEEDFPGSVFLDDDRARLLPFLEGVRIGSENVFDALQKWHDTYLQPWPSRGREAATPAEAVLQQATGTTTDMKQGHEGSV